MYSTLSLLSFDAPVGELSLHDPHMQFFCHNEMQTTTVTFEH